MLALGVENLQGLKQKQETGSAPVSCPKFVATECYAVNEDPHPQLPVEFGFLNVKPEPMTPVTRTADRRRRARGEEPAERDDDPPRAAARASSRPARARVGAGGRRATPRDAPTDARRSSTSTVIGGEIRRLDQVVQGFLKFMRPRGSEAAARGRLASCSTRASRESSSPTPPRQHPRRAATVRRTCRTVQRRSRAMLRQALFNLALNACQAMPDGGTLRLTAQPASGRRVVIDGRGHRRRHPARASAADLRPVLHDQGGGQRHRAVDGVSHDSAARRRD